MFEGEHTTKGDNNLLVKVHLAVTLVINARGFLNGSAQDKFTGKRWKIATASSASSCATVSVAALALVWVRISEARENYSNRRR